MRREKPRLSLYLAWGLWTVVCFFAVITIPDYITGVGEDHVGTVARQGLDRSYLNGGRVEVCDWEPDTRNAGVRAGTFQVVDRNGSKYGCGSGNAHRDLPWHFTYEGSRNHAGPTSFHNRFRVAADGTIIDESGEGDPIGHQQGPDPLSGEQGPPDENGEDVDD